MQRISNIVVLEEAADDLIAGRHFYDQQELGLGQYFWDSLISDVESLVIYAGVHQRFFGLFRLLSNRFPYAVYYEVAESVAYVIAVLPVRRNPAWVQQQFENR